MGTQGGPLSGPSVLSVDHVTLAASDLDRARERFAAVGLATDYGGQHAGGATHMALLGFDDGSYLEVISAASPGPGGFWWPEQIAADAGLCGWCIRSNAIDEDCRRLREAGIPVRGPERFHRVRPDGTPAEWSCAFPGDGPPGALLPFLIQDHTPRTLRVRASASVAGSELTGVAFVTVGVRDLAAGSRLFQRAFGWEAPVPPPTGAAWASGPHFAGTPVVLVQSESGRAEGPVACVLGSTDFTASQRRWPHGRPDSWRDRRLLWLELDGDRPNWRLGVIATEDLPT